MKFEDLPQLPPEYCWKRDAARYYIQHIPSNEEYITILGDKDPIKMVYWGAGMRRRWQDTAPNIEAAIGVVTGRLWLGEWS